MDHIVGAARATEDPRNICLSEPLAPILKFPTRTTVGKCQEKKKSIVSLV